MAFEDRTLVCRSCGKEFTFTAGEQEFFSEKGLQNEPRHCRECREANRREHDSGGRRESYAVVCARCGAETTVPFKPTGDRPVYCRNCFVQTRNAAES